MWEPYGSTTHRRALGPGAAADHRRHVFRYQTKESHRWKVPFRLNEIAMEYSVFMQFPFTTHGHARRFPATGKKRAKKTRTYLIWLGMKARCQRKTDWGYHNYGGRGISVCERWQSFVNFLADMGEAPAGLSLDRIDNNGNYEPGNCRWATAEEQQSNTRQTRLLSLGGETMTMTRWCRRLGMKKDLVHARLARGWSVEKALTTPSLSNGNGGWCQLHKKKT